MKSAQASQAKQENNTMKRSAPRMTLCRKIAADCAKEGRIVNINRQTKRYSLYTPISNCDLSGGLKLLILE